MLKVDEWIKKADTLLEALPYIQKFRGALIVVKFGGSSMEDPELAKSTMRDIVLMECIGFKPIVVHGGGKAISAINNGVYGSSFDQNEAILNITLLRSASYCAHPIRTCICNT